jgi:hypothetical protein
MRATTGRLWALLVASGLAGAVVLAPAAPASAVSSAIVINGPSAGSAFTAGVTSAPVAITGTASIPAALLENNVVTDVQVAVNFGSAQPYGCAHAADCAATVGQGTTNFSYTPVVTRNGPYTVTATVTGSECTVLGCSPRTANATTNFSVGVRPAAPRNVQAQVNSNGSVTVSWSANPEPDVIGYQILRVDPKASSGHVVNSFLTGTSWTDTGTAANGGTFGYSVVAFRPGSSGTVTSALPPLFAQSATANADVPIPVPDTTVPPGGVPVANTTTTTSAPALPLDLSGFLTQATKAGAIPAAPPKAVVHTSPAPRLVIPSAQATQGSFGPPDTYAPTLPYNPSGSAPAATTPASGRALPQVALPAQPTSHHGRSLLFPLAGGLLLCVLGLGLRTMNRGPRGAPLEPLAAGDTAVTGRRPPFRVGAGAGGRVGAGAGAGAGATTGGTARAGAARATRAGTGAGTGAGATSGGTNLPASIAAKSAAKAMAAAVAASSVGADAAFANPGPKMPAAADPVPERVPKRAAEPATAAAPATPATAATSPVIGAAPAALAMPAPASQPAPASPAPARRWKKSSVEDAVEYFRLIKTTDSAEDDKVEVGTPSS